MKITKYDNSISENVSSHSNMEKDYALFAIGCGAINSVKKAFENTALREQVSFFKCESIQEKKDANQPPKETAEMTTAMVEILKVHSIKKAIVVSTLGGRTGTGYAPIMSKLLAGAGCKLTCIVTLPFSFEGQSRLERSQEAVAEMSKYAGSTTIFNMDILRNLEREKKVEDFFSIVDNYIEKAVTNCVLGQ